MINSESKIIFIHTNEDFMTIFQTQPNTLSNENPCWHDQYFICGHELVSKSLRYS